MKETFYFPHDNNAHNDPKLMSLFMAHGLSGIGLYWILIEIMHQQDDGIISEKQFGEFVSWYSMKENKPSTFVEQVLNTFKTVGIFCFEDENVFSKRVIENKEFRKDLIEKRREAGKKSAEKRALKKPKTSKRGTSVEQKGTNAQQGKERKGKENEKEIDYSSTKNNSDETSSSIIKKGPEYVIELQQELIGMCSQLDRESIMKEYKITIMDYKKISEDFLLHWGEPNKRQTKIKWQLEQTFDVNLRFKKFVRNFLDWKTKNNSGKKSAGVTVI